MLDKDHDLGGLCHFDDKNNCCKFMDSKHLGKITGNLPQNFWKFFDRTLERNEGYARQTYAAHKQLLQFGIDTSLARPGRLVIWTSHESADSTSQIKIKDASCISSYTSSATSPWRRLIGNSFTLIVIFSDSFGLIQSSGQIFLESPLVWMNSFSGKSLDSGTEEAGSTLTEVEKELTVQVLAPEYEFHIEFPAVEMKNDLLNAFSASFRLHRERSELTVFDDSVGTSVHVLPQTRYGSYDYSNTHYLYRNCHYEGFWKNGVPHGQGSMRFPDGREYRGRFDHGQIQGFGEMKIPDILKAPSPLMSSVFFTENSPKKSEKYHHYKGKWKNGKLHGLSQILYSNGDSYEGYCAFGVPEGHGVYRSNEGIGGQQVYVGAWSKGVKHGYGVLSLNKERYLGMWKDDQQHDRGCQITIDGVFHEGIFDRNRFTKGKVVYQQHESEIPASFEGEFEKIGVLAGKGVLKLTPRDQIEGIIHGQILTGELKITNATYTRKESRSFPNESVVELQIVEEGPIVSQWSVPADLKWKEIFDYFLYEELGFSPEGEITEEQVKRAWERLSASVEKIKTLKNLQIDDRLERIPEVQAEWSASYYSTVTEYWHLCLSTPHHPIYRLINGLVEIFCCSYNNIGTHSIMYDSAVLEFISLIQRTYNVFLHIFPNLPPVERMYQSVPEERKAFDEDQEKKVVDEDKEKDFSIASNSSSENGSIKSDEIHQRKNTKSPSSEEFTVATPCCDFVIHYLFGQCYAELFTMYSVKCHEMDKRYWERVVFLNTATDAKLLSYLGVEKNLWPTDGENTSDLDKFMVRVTARKKFYETAIHTLQRLSCEFNPSSKLAILAETFSEISAVGLLLRL
ncbi:hypothetical protein FO519_001197 [Halicephalobus sp. NKZ332]|nr:hypothetical protein FO519_001197 [Halicephalobus sp. NKZ332]